MAETSGRYDKRNFLLNVAEGALYIAGSSFISAQTVLPALVAKLGGGSIAVGLVGVIVWVGLFFPQIFAARYTQTLPWKKNWTIRFGLLQRVIVICIAAAMLVWGGSDPTLALILFFSLYTVNQILIGITTPGWFELYAKLTPIKSRGRLIGIRNSLGGALALACGFILTWVLRAFGFPFSYALVIACGFLLQLFSIILQWQLVEEHPSRVLLKQAMPDYLKQLPNVFRHNIEFRKFIVASAFLILASMPMGFYTVYALQHFHADESVVGEFTLTIVGTQVASSLLNGYIADRYGNRIVLILAACAMLCSSVSAFLIDSLPWFPVVFVFLGINLGSELMTRYNISIEYGPVEQRSTYVGLMNTVLAPVYLAGLLGGWLANMFGYPAVFVVGASSSVVGIVLLWTRVREPRTLHPMAEYNGNP